MSTGDALSGPVPPYAAGDVPPPRIAALLRNAETLMHHIRTEPIAIYQTKVESDWVWVVVPT